MQGTFFRFVPDRRRKCEIYLLDCPTSASGLRLFLIIFSLSLRLTIHENSDRAHWYTELYCNNKRSLLFVWGVRWEVWGVRYEIWEMRCKMWGVRSEVWGVRCEMWGVRCEIWDVRCKMWDVRCEVWDLRCEVWKVRWGVMCCKLSGMSSAAPSLSVVNMQQKYKIDWKVKLICHYFTRWTETKNAFW